MPGEVPDRWGRRQEVVLLALIAGVVAGVLGLRAFPGSPLVGLDHALVDRVVAAGASAPVDTSAVTIVLVDDESLASIGERWPLRRRTWADFISALHGYEPVVVAVDAWFESPEPTVEADLALDLSDRLRLTGLSGEPLGGMLADQLDALALDLDGDRRLAVALGAGTPVILGTACVADPPDVSPEGLFAAPGPARPRMACPGLSGNVPTLAMSARGQAGLDVMHDPDGHVRRYAYVSQAGDLRQDSLALAAVTVARPDAAPAARDRVAALDGAAPFLRIVDPAQFTAVRFADVLFAGPDNEGLDAAFRGRIVFVGVSAQGTEDLVFTALGSAVPGVTLHANAAIDLLQGRHIHSDGAPALVGFVLGMGLLAGVSLGGSRVTAAPSIVGVGLLAATAWAAVGGAAVGFGFVLPEVPVLAGLGASTLVRLGFIWVRTDAARRLAQAQREQLLTELRVARDIQLAMVPTTMPAFPGRDLVGISASLEPAREVGGDFYDYFPLSDGRVCFAVGDVSGKGVGAALYMARIQTMLRSRATLDPSPASIVTHANDELARDNDTAMFVTLVVAILDLKQRDLVWTNAGHNPPYVLRADGTRVRLDARHGPAVGAIENIEYRQATMTLEPGDQVLLFTDGVTEAMDTGAALYGEERLVASIAAVRSHEETVKATLAAVRQFQGDAAQADDITVLALQLGPR